MGLLLPTTCHVVIFFGIVVRSQLPPASQLNANLPGQTMSAARADPASSDVVQGIAGLMQRVEQLQPQLSRLPETDVARLGQEGQQLHERFIELQEKLRNMGSQIGIAEESRLVRFHQDLALFVQNIESQLGISGPYSTLSAAAPRPLPSTLPPLQPLPNQGSGVRANIASQPSLGNALTPGTDKRLQTAMTGVANGMQRFQSLHPQMRTLPQEILSDISRRGQQLHEEFTLLQQRGVALTSDNARQMSEADGVEYAVQMEDFTKRMTSFIDETERQLRSGPKTTANSLPSARVGVGHTGSTSFGSGLGSIGGGLPPLSPVAFGGGGGSGTANTLSGDRITPATDQRLSAVIDKVVNLMRQFESLRPQLSRLPQQAFQKVSQRGEELNNRFVALQQRGAAIAGDGSAPMPEREANAYVVDMEAFHADQSSFVDEARQALQSGGSGVSMAPLGSASLPGSLSGSSLGSPSQFGSGRFGSASLTGSSLGGPILGESSNAIPNGRSTSGSFAGAGTDARLSDVIQKVASVMKEFETLKPNLSRLPQHVFAQIARRGQELNDRFIALQQRGAAMAGDGSQPLPVQEANTYTNEMEAFHMDQKAFVEEAKQAMQSGSGLGSAAMPPLGGLSTGGMAPNAGTGLGSSGNSGALPPLSLGSIRTSQAQGLGSAQGLGGDRITPATDQRLSAVIEKVVNLMKEFEALRPQLSRLPQQVFQKVAQRGQELNDRFVALQQRGAAIAGDGSAPMPEREANAYVVDMEAFHAGQSSFVDEAKQALQSGGSGVSMAPLGSASLPGSISGSSLGSPSQFGSGSLGSASLPRGSLGAARSPSGGSLGTNSFGVGSFSDGSLGSSPGKSIGSLGIPSLGSSSNAGPGMPQGSTNMRDSLTNFGAVQLNTNILSGS